MKIKANKKYIYDPVTLDIIDPRTDLKGGEVVTVVSLPGCPPPGTMSHAHIDYKDSLAGLVHVNSLRDIK